MDTDDILDWLQEVLSWSTDNDVEVKKTITFNEAGILTMDKGLIVTLTDGTEFYLTVTKA